MKVLVEFDQSGTHQDNPWDAPVVYAKGEIHHVTPLHAVQLIQSRQAHLFKNEKGDVIFSA
ncbi:hypothetical protein OAP63_18165 [Vibrio sp.]|uniref:Uncharacterized protein n=1 Tax=Vibrio viridaestus TaxID=2487322 RepID=A0A3N9TKD2_9VIBR|nr:hypothetical protein [Vibrio viridaestus]MDC0612662.1 hypothetical protein [Vibrio sp.]RQW64737.1 hypothetical protein EES38_01435 [Vibrio viridaestus]